MPSSETGNSSSERPAGCGSDYHNPAHWQELKAWYQELTRVGRLILILHHADGLTPAEIGAVLKLQETTVASQLRAFRVRARAILRKHGVGDGTA